MKHMDTPPKARGRGRSGPRRRTGCLTCRARKVRCDEAKPTCTNCTRLRLQCDYRNVIIQGLGLPKTRARARPRLARARSGSSTATTTAQESPGSKSHTEGTIHLNGVERVQQLPALTSGDIHPDGASITPDSNIPFDMLGFIGEITMDFQQKHLDLTNGETLVYSTAPVTFSDVDSNAFPQAQQTPWDPLEPDTSNAVAISQPASVSAQRAGEETWKERLLQYFRESEPPPTIFAPVDLDWRYVRDAILDEVTLGSPGCRALLLAVYSYSDTHMAWIGGTHPKLGLDYHEQASSDIQTCLIEEEVSEALLKRVFATVLLLMLAEVYYRILNIILTYKQLISPESWKPEISYLRTSYLLQRFHPRIKYWTGIAHLIASWVLLLDIKTLIAGRDGDPLADLGDLTPLNPNPSSSSSPLIQFTEDSTFEKHPSSPANLITHAITSPAFTFFLQTQQLTRRIVVIDLHHRSRGTVSDEFEVLQIAHTVSADLESLWNKRPKILDLYKLSSYPTTSSNRHGEESLLTVLNPQTAAKIVTTFRTYVANFLALFIYLHRVAFAIYPRTDKVSAAVDQIIRLAREESSRPCISPTPSSSSSSSSEPEPPRDTSTVSISFLWPLFIAALEGSLEQRAWIIDEIQRMAAPAPASANGNVPGERCDRHPNAAKALLLLQEMTRRQDASCARTWADSKCVRRELFVDFFVMI
ncbi:hypothetical protein BDW74DRAFT_187226 [Aspergillus multicolor]|uniref:Zn(II)2Cys6 transcription factor n=1 Tax=Aspergillus multicolor TaxID=41759 RepID=UPI003CCCD1F9